MPALRPVVSSPLPSESGTCESLRIRLSTSNSSVRTARAATVVGEVPATRSGSSGADIHRRPPSFQSCCWLAGPLRPAGGFPALPARSLLLRLLRVLRHVPTATADGAPAPSKLGGHRRGASHVHSYAGRQGRRSAVPRGHRHGLPPHGPRPRPPEEKAVGRDGPRPETGARAPQTAHSRQFRGRS